MRTIYMKTKHIWRLLMLLFVLTALFVVESILFLPILQWNTNAQSGLPTRSRQERESKIKHAMFRHQLIQEKRNRTKYIRVDSTSLHLPKHLLPFKKTFNTSFSNSASQMLHCEDILEISLVKRIGKGTTKEVWKATYQNKEIAVKLVSNSVEDIRTCLNRVGNDEEERRRCYVYANYKLMKEISLLLDLQHPNIIKVLGYCILQDESIFGDDHSIVSVVEIGERLTRRKVLSMSWTKRMQICSDVLSLLHHLETSRIGSLLLSDFKLSQMVMVNGTVKLADLDDLAPEEQRCTSDLQCYFKNKDLGVSCVQSMCHGRNAKLNLLGFLSNFQKIIISDIPAALESEVNAAVQRLEKLQVSSGKLVDVFKTFQRYTTK